ncbi:hypothetical protein DIPPA_35410 [Diplonema papillatum]|nr:hypothetical protein DIPPA_35410 [Diplonema papillatum]
MACQDPEGGGFFSRKTFPIYTASELKRKIAEKERRGADDVASRLRADGRHVPHIEPIDERAERSLRLTACAFIWDCGNTGRMSSKVAARRPSAKPTPTVTVSARLTRSKF